MNGDNFAHLHVHTEYSMLDGAARIGELVQAAAAQNMPAIAVTDHGNMFGAFDFWRQAKDAGIKPIIGIEAYLTPGTHRSVREPNFFGNGGPDDVSGKGAYTHMTMLAETTQGMHNLFRLSTYSSLEGQYFKPRMDVELLERYAKGIIATTGCPSGEIQTRLRLGQYEEARAAAARFQDIFGKDNFFAEIMDHGLEIERRVTKDLLRLAKELNIPLVGTNDLHYTHQHDATSHEALLCVQSGSTIDDPNRFKFDGDGYYLKSAAEMRHLLRDFPAACDNTLLIAERCNAEFNQSANFMPHFPVPDGESEESWFIKEVERGLKYRYPQGISDEVRKQAEYETEVITQMGFPGYFLVVADFINWAKDNGIRVGPGRGSGAGSMAAYAMRITDLDPLEHGLIFERFLNPDRVSMPDFDVDFDDRRRGEVIQYVTEKYGDERVAQIVTYGTIKSKQALKDAGRVLGYPFSVGEKLTKAMPPAVMGKDIPLSGIFDGSHPRHKEAAEIRDLIQTDPNYQRVFETATGLEGLKRQWGVHAAGVIMSSDPLVDIIPLMKREADGQIITQFDYPTCEGLGLIKMDFLGLRNLTIISDAIENIKLNRGFDLDLEALELDDRASYELLARGDTLGVFQLDGGPMRSLLRLMKPDNFEDISAVLALYRPGPMGADSHTNYALRKNGKQEIVPIHPELAEPLADILDTTYGLIIYQEQVMAIAQRVAGYSLGQADILRRAMGKKKKAELDKQFTGFASGMQERGYSMQAVQTLWDILLPFSDYAFNKAHSAAYGVISYWTAYLKAHYPAEYMAALLTSVGNKDKDKLALYLNECRRMGISVLAPDVNESVQNFSAVGEEIRFGLGAVRNVGHNVVQGIIEGRKQAKYDTFSGFVKAVPVHVLNKRTVESLIKAGAFDSLGKTRRSLVEAHEGLIEQGIRDKKDAASGNIGFDFDSLFAEANATDDDSPASVDQIVDLPEYSKRDKLAFEREMIGLYVSDHPLSGLDDVLTRECTHQVLQVIGEESDMDGETVTLAGLLTSVELRTAKSGKMYGMAALEDYSGEIEVLFMGNTFQEYRAKLIADSVVSIRGRLNKRDDKVSMHAYSITNVNVANAGTVQPVTVRIPDAKATERAIQELQRIVQRHRGSSDVFLELELPDGQLRRFQLRERVRAATDLFGELKALFGKSCIVSASVGNG
ncbi:DNA polymerase III subunit alpha [Canibacter zhoujuaniae]|uniref:DNA polymerase III subunit alpha n=1 Tax=Canibacter zhoujuaniae TaxID=2708343 RepID=UPI00141DFCA3|nr:DNA polymerase III subunit alpha [Canibacter zhoujuaniae]